MKKVVTGVTVLALILSLGMTVMAAEENDDWFQKNYEFRKDYINQKLEEGLITEKQAEYMLDRLETAKKYYQENGDSYSFEERYELQKDHIKDQLKEGLITEEQANYMLNRLEERKEYYEENGAYTMPYGRRGMGPMMATPDMMGLQGQGFGPYGCGMRCLNYPGLGQLRLGFGPYGCGMRSKGRGYNQRGRW